MNLKLVKPNIEIVSISNAECYKLLLFNHIQRQELILLHYSPAHSNDNESHTSIRIKTNLWSTREYFHTHLDSQNMSKALSQGETVILVCTYFKPYDIG